MKQNHFNIAVLLFICASVFSQNPLQNRKPFAAGRFYPDNPDELEAKLKLMFLKSAQKKFTLNPLAILVPHAGYVYSGEVAASAYNQIDPYSKFERIFIIGSSHTTEFTGAAVYSSGNFETPLGTVKVDIDFAKQLVRNNKILINYPEAHKFEHSIEVQLPFLQHHLHNDFQIVPVIVGSSAIETARQLAAIFKPYFNEKNLFIISTDFSHYPEYYDALRADRFTAEAIKTNNASNLIAALDSNKKKNLSGLATSLCGWSSVLTLLYMTEQKKELDIDLIHYQNSGDSSYGEKSRVVGYWAISFNETQKEILDPGIILTGKDKKELLSLARSTITAYIKSGVMPEFNPADSCLSLQTYAGAFVTLTKNKRLRGCIGHFDADLPLWKVIQKMAIASATMDNRFGRVGEDEIHALKIEISVLTPMKRIRSIDEFIPGKHGIYIKKGRLSGTFLPQVALQTGWSKEEFLGHCSQDKAGIGWDGWKTAELYTYEALIFGEQEVKDENNSGNK